MDANRKDTASANRNLWELRWSRKMASEAV